MEITITHNPLISVGYLSVDVPSDVMAAIKIDIQDMLNTDFQNVQQVNKRLYGAIEKEYRLNTSSNLVSKFACAVAREYWKFTSEKNNFNKNHFVNNIWVNFQKKYEFNPLHSHMSCDLSFVLWVKIPYNLELEKKMSHVCNSNMFNDETTAFTFLYPDPYNPDGISKKILQIDSNYEGKMIVFPSSLQHIVYPFFTSDEYRISVAGNIELED